MELDNAIHQLLRTYWGFNSFRAGQEEIILSVCKARDTVGILPTGSGKSICYQISGLYLEGVVLVVSPLIALMEDQVQSLKKRAIKAAALHSGKSKRQQDILLDNAIYGDLKFVFLSPERIKSNLFKERLKKMNVGLIVVDEAHCISEWGHDFRPSYRNIATLKNDLPGTPVLALTATAKPAVAEDIQSNLELDNPFVYSSSPLRSQLSYNVYKADNKRYFICSLLKLKKEVSIVYCSSRKMVMELWKYLSAHGLQCSFFHGGLESKEKEKESNKWFKGETHVMIATKAFGMGIDKSDVRTVFHYQIPDSLEAYVQEAGRAGRDQNFAAANLVFNDDDILKFNRLLSEFYPDIEFIKQVYLDIAQFLDIPAGERNEEEYKFDINEFLNAYQHPRTATLNAIKLLVENEFITVTDALLHPSELKLNQKEVLAALRDNYIADSLKSFIQLLLRNYEGLYYGYTVIDEKALARLFESKIDKVITALEWINKKGVGYYRKKYKGIYLGFLHFRYDRSSFEMDEQQYLKQKQRQIDNRTDIEEFLKTELCRQVFIAQYFGFKETPCGICDNCRLSEHMSQNTQFRNEIIALVDEGPIGFHDLVFKFDPALSKIVISDLKALNQENEIQIKGLTITKV